MGYYLVDYENVKKDGLNGIDMLMKEDTVCIFYSENADTITFDMHRRINESKANVIFQKVEVGTKNALDFQLATYLGYLIAKNESGMEYYVVSKDTGFNALCSYWEAQKISVSMVADVSGRNVKKEQDELTKEVGRLIGNTKDVSIVVKMLQQYKTKQGINNALNKNYKDGKRASEIYKAIKPLMADKKGREE